MSNNENAGFYKLNWVQRIGFGAGDMAQNLIYQTISMWLLFFYTNVFGIKPGVAATMFLIVRIIDVIWDPIVGAFVDKKNPKEFINIFFESGSLSDDNKKEVINYFFSKLS